ncbi:c-type cytochrome [Roseiconus nitratireducens]|uniref:C-type cytochrome n=1 Tax=Roseiconus nitratireducens TaxID=2605748 RepID=A0A5M6D5J3_9BACT|nr:c-type cytochrome [Roseiconus nitratireducens]KAA5542623.1 c-type cytochrome [Roseiconus nitratireducens]
MKRRLKELSILIVCLALLGAVVLVSGVVPIKASSGHWAITRWVLDFASSRSVSFHSRGIQVPKLDQPSIADLGAATFDNNCRWCHGAPGIAQPPVAAGMTPRPPRLSEAVQQWEEAELFYIVKHGIKFAGMPAWATGQRDDEVWPVVAFLRDMPSWTEQDYRDVVQVDPSDTSERAVLAAQRCAACHGLSGGGRAGSRVPDLAGQHVDYLSAALRAYRDGKRFSGIMQPVAADLDDEKIAGLAEYFAAQPRSENPGSETLRGDAGREDSQFQVGKNLARNGDQNKKIPSCIDCHALQPPAGHQDYPMLVGLSADYIRRQLELFQSRSRGGSEHANLMHPIADKLSNDQIEALATYYSQVKLDPGDPPPSNAPED